jgi:hypothetical protein
MAEKGRIVISDLGKLFLDTDAEDDVLVFKGPSFFTLPLNVEGLMIITFSTLWGEEGEDEILSISSRLF